MRGCAERENAEREPSNIICTLRQEVLSPSDGILRKGRAIPFVGMARRRRTNQATELDSPVFATVHCPKINHCLGTQIPSASATSRTLLERKRSYFGILANRVWYRGPSIASRCCKVMACWLLIGCLGNCQALRDISNATSIDCFQDEVGL